MRTIKSSGPFWCSAIPMFTVIFPVKIAVIFTEKFYPCVQVRNYTDRKKAVSPPERENRGGSRNGIQNPRDRKKAKEREVYEKKKKNERGGRKERWSPSVARAHAYIEELVEPPNGSASIGKVCPGDFSLDQVPETPFDSRLQDLFEVCRERASA